MIPLDPPDRICGPMDSSTSKVIINERRRWIVDARLRGYKLKAIAKALGITAPRVASLLHEERIVIRKDSGDELNKATKFGCRFGNIREALRHLPQGAQRRLVNESARTGKTFAQILAESYATTSPG